MMRSRKLLSAGEHRKITQNNGFFMLNLRSRPLRFEMRRLLFLHVVLFAGCSVEPQSGPGEVRWDRETCARCAMAVSDPHYSAQVRGGPPGGSSRLYKFDDIGCALLWLEKQPWRENPATEIWVNDHRDGAWLDARSAWYVTGKITPMDYGLGAQREKSANSITYTAAVEHIHGKDAQLDSHAHMPATLPGRLPPISE
jgi:copper chaperone NosL